MTKITSFSSDSGIIGDGITNDSTLTLIGAADANSTVKLYDGTTLLGTVATNSSGAWSYTTGTLSDGAHSFTAVSSTGGGTGGVPSTFPDASTTGVRDGVTLKSVSGQFTTSYDGQVIEGINADSIVINNANVTVRDCRVGSIFVSASAPNATIEYTDVYGKNSINSVDLEGNNGTIRYCDISGSENGIWLEADGALIEKNYIHNLFSNNGNPDPHIDGIQVPGSNIGAAASENAIIRDNNIYLDNSTANACLTLNDVVNFDITNNRFNGGSYVVYFEGAARDSQLVNNVFAQYTYGYVSGASETSQTYSGNVTAAGASLVQSNTRQDLVVSTSSSSTGTTGSTTSTSAAFVVTVDTKAPDAPTIVSESINSTNQVVLSGNAEANSAIKVFDGTTQIGTATTNSSGVWSLTTSALSTGTHSLTAKATDAAGNVSAASSAVGAVVGNAAPTIASFSTDSGVVGDGITNDNTLELKGIAAAGSTVKIYDGSDLIGTTTAGSTGTWDYITSILTDAKHVLTATATSAGQTSVASAALTVTVDTVAPTAPVLVGNSITNTNHVLLSGTAEANSKIAVYDGTTVVGTGTTDSAGNWSVTTSALSGGTHALTAKATDAAGNVGTASSQVDSVIGTAVEALGSTDLVQVGKNYFLTPAGGTGPELKFDGAVVVAGQFGAWTPIGVEATGSGYQIAWKVQGTDQYTVWKVDSGGNYVGQVTGLVSGSSTDLESLETSFHQDLNGDGTMGIVSTTMEALGSTSLVQGGANYFLNPAGGGTGPELKFGGAVVVAGQFGGWTPIGAEATGSGYQVAWKVQGMDQYTVWNVDSSGNYVGQATGLVSGSSTDLASLETSFHQDLNGDGTIGIPSTVIESSGSTSLVQMGPNYFLNPAGGGTGPELKFDGAVVVAGQFGGWTPIGVEATTSGYQVAWKVQGMDQYTVWNVDSSGNYVGQATGLVSGNSTDLEALETSFHQDLNGDGVMGIPSATTQPGATTQASAVSFNNVLAESSNIVTLKGVADASSQIKFYDGNLSLGTATAGADGTWSFKTSSALSDTVHTFKAQETDSTGHVIASSGSAILGSTGRDTLTSSSGNDFFVGNGSADTFVFAPNFGHDVIGDFVASGSRHDTIQFSKNVFDSFASVLSHASQVGQDVVISTTGDTLTLKNTKLDGLNSHDFHFA